LVLFKICYRCIHILFTILVKVARGLKENRRVEDIADCENIKHKNISKFEY